jgi:predicted enzyme related to lactoylglutathione lyase
MKLKPGNICYLEIPAPDLNKAAKFYTKVFSWKVGPKFSSGYWGFDDGHLGGGFDASAKPNKTGINLYIKVTDIPATLTVIAKAGGKVTKEKTAIYDGQFGHYACFRDPNGNQLSLWSKK